MSVKVGSAGTVIESVLQHPNNQDKSRKNESNESKRSKNTITSIVPTGVRKSRDVNAIADTQRARALSDVENVSAVVTTNRSQTQKTNTSDENSVLQQQVPVSAEVVKEAVQEANKKLAPTNSSVEFSYHEKTGRYSFRVMDKETGAVLREVPPEDTLDVVAKMWDMVGLHVDEKL